MKKIAISLGDINGVSAEIIAKFLATRQLPFTPCIYGTKEVFLQWAEIFQKNKILGCEYWDIFFNKVESKKILFALEVEERMQKKKIQVKVGEVCASSGSLSSFFFQQAIKDTLDKKNAALVTAPINKVALQKAGIPYKGHTPILIKECGVKNYTMAFSSPELLLALVTDHIPLGEVVKNISSEKILQTIFLCAAFAKFSGLAKPKIAVCGLNPHAGEEGLLGDEDRQIIVPAIKKAQQQSIDAFGPVAADSIFYKAKSGELDAIVAMYHDQGLCGWKSAFFTTSAQVSLGFPIVRTSVSHGSAFDIAGLGLAKENSLAYACQLADKMSSAKIAIKL